MEISKKYVPTLKDDLKISGFDESNSYILYFEKSGQSLKINENIKTIYDQINGMRTLHEIYQNISITIIKSYEDFEAVFKHIFVDNCIINGTADLIEEKSIFLFKIKILNEKIINVIFQFTKYLLNKYILILTITGYLISRIITYSYFYHKVSISDFSLINFLLLYFFTVLTLIFHEFGHISFSKLFGIKSGFIGIGLYYVMPVFYADVSGIWKLNNKKRCLIDFGGIYFQMIISLLLIITYYFYRTPVVYYGIILNDIGILINLVPAGKLDGYWILKDYFGVSDLHKEANIILKSLKIGVFSSKNGLFLFYYIVYILFSVFIYFIISKVVLQSIIDFKNVYLKNINLIYLSFRNYNLISLKSSVTIIIYNIIFFISFIKISFDFMSFLKKYYVKYSK